jgi:hypothetical protein
MTIVEDFIGSDHARVNVDLKQVTNGWMAGDTVLHLALKQRRIHNV